MMGWEIWRGTSCGRDELTVRPAIGTNRGMRHPAPSPLGEIVRAHSAFHQALREGDASALDRLLDEHFTWTHTDGLVQSKSDLVEKIRGGKLRYAELSTDQEIFNEYAKAAVVTGHSKRRYADAAKPFDLRYTLTLVKVGREWKVAA